jgi:hypothetical protein
LIDENRGGEGLAIILGCLPIPDGEVIQDQAAFSSIVLPGLFMLEECLYPAQDLHHLFLVNQYHPLRRRYLPVLHRENLLYISVADEAPL